MAAIEGENTVNPTVYTGPDGVLLLPVLSGENTTHAAGASGASSTPRVSIESKVGTVRRSVR